MTRELRDTKIEYLRTRADIRSQDVSPCLNRGKIGRIWRSSFCTYEPQNHKITTTHLASASADEQFI